MKPLMISKPLLKRFTRTSGFKWKHLRSDHGKEFQNSKFDEFFSNEGLDHNFSASRTPQQNGVVERQNGTLDDMARTTIIASDLPKSLWAEVVDIACYIINRVTLRPITLKTPYELHKPIYL